jgi:hypothetical protein
MRFKLMHITTIKGVSPIIIGCELELTLGTGSMRPDDHHSNWFEEEEEEEEVILMSMRLTIAYGTDYLRH